MRTDAHPYPAYSPTAVKARGQFQRRVQAAALVFISICHICCSLNSSMTEQPNFSYATKFQRTSLRIIYSFFLLQI